MANPICYGDIVYIDFNDLFLTTNGFYDPTLFLASTENIALKSFKNGLFKLYPNLSYKDMTQVDELRHQLDLLRSLNTEEKFAADQLDKDLENEQKALEAREARLDELNEKMYAESKGQPIKYSQKIQLFHIESQTFVTVTKKLNKEDKTLMSLELTPKGSKSLYFMFMPKLAFSQEGEVVEYNTPIKFISCKYDTSLAKGPELNLDVMKTELNPASNSITNQEDNFPQVAPRRKEPLFDSAKVFYSGMKMIEVPENIYVRKFMSLEAEENAKVKKALKNGDYVRISNDKLYFTAYRNRDKSSLFFQAFNNSYEYRFSKTATLFQILEIDDDYFEEANAEKDIKLNPSKFPLGHLLEYDENKRYLLKHVVSGMYLATENGELTLVEYKDPTQDLQKVSLLIKNRSGNGLGDNYIDRNSVIQFKFHTKADEEIGILTSGIPIKIPNTQLEINTWYYYGFTRPENYLNKWLRTERNECKLDKIVDDQFSSFRLVVPTVAETASIFLVESFTNSLQKFLDFLDDFTKKINTSLKDFNDEIKKLSDISAAFASHLYEEEYNAAEEDILTPDTTRQTMIREFRAYDLIYRVFLYVAQDSTLTNIYKGLKEQAGSPVPPEENKEQDHEKENAKVKVEKNHDIDVKTEINFLQMTKLLKALQKVILISFKKNDLNHYYCSQFIRISINCIVDGKEGLYTHASKKEELQIKELMLVLCQEGLWDKDLDALGQLNYYEASLFEAIEQQTSYHTVFLKLMKHIASSKAPNLQNLIRDNFVYNFISKSINLSHVFPQLVEEDMRICIQFKRKKDKEQNRLLDISDLASTMKNISKEEKSNDDILLHYFLESVHLIFALISVESSMLELKLIRYLTFENVTKAIQTLANVPQYRDVRVALKELISKVHQNYFALPFTKLPKQVQILDRSSSLKSANSDINGMIKNSVETSLSTAELEYIKDEEITDIIESLKSQIASENQVIEVLKTLETRPSIEYLELSRTILEDIKKVLESNAELSFDLLKRAREVLNLFLESALKRNEKAYWDFIKQCLEVYNLMETKTLAYAATDIVRVLKEQNLFGRSVAHHGSPNKHNKDHRDSDVSSPIEPLGHSDSVESGTLLRPNVKVTPEHLGPKELSTKNIINESILANVVDSYMRQWKNGERFLLESSGTASQILRNRNRIEEVYRESTSEDNMKILLEIFLLNQDHLLSDVIHRLKKVSSFESLLYRELNRLTILYDDESLGKTTHVIKTTFRLNEIARDIFFCKDNLVEVEKTRLDGLLKEVLEHQWNLFFILYEPARHFRHLPTDKDAKKEFREAFEKEKKVRWDKTFRLRPEAINKPYQKVFNILTTYKSLLKTQHWVLDKKTGFEDDFILHNYIIRLNILLLTAFVMNSKENQILFSEAKGIIRQFYNQHFLNQSPDAMLIFAEIMRDNKKLLKLPVKYLYDITMSTFVGTMARTITNTETNGYLDAGLRSMHFMSQSMIPVELFNSISDMKGRWEQISKVDDFTALKITNSEEAYETPFCYNSIRSTMEATLEIAAYFSSHKYANDIQLFLDFPYWIKFFQNENFLMQYELKNCLTKCMTRIYYEHESKHKFVQESEECLNIISSLVADIIFYREHKLKKSRDDDNNALYNLTRNSNFITNYEKFINIRKLYDGVRDIDLGTKRMRIDIEETVMENILSEYVYEGCLDLLFHIVLKEVDFCKEIREAHHEVSSIMDFILILLDEFILGEQNNPYFPFLKIENFLTQASVVNSYTRYKEKILKLANRVYLHGKTRQNKASKAKKTSEAQNPLEFYDRHINNLQVSRKMYKEQNIKQVADCIADHPQNKTIINQIIKYLKKDPTKLDTEEAIFILKLLRKYIERENTNNPEDEPIYLWKEINLNDLKKIEKIQQAYRFHGLSNIIFIFFGNSDPKIFRENLLLSLAYMYGGNADVQRDFYNSFREDDDNKVIIQLRDKLKDSWEFFRGKETKRMKYLYTAVQKSMFEYFKGKKSEFQVDEQELQIKIFQTKIEQQYLDPAENLKENQIFMQTLTFLQGLCEGQFMNMQVFLREQKSEDRCHPKSFDFLGFLRHSTNTYYKVMNRYNLGIGNKILDLIIELIQGEVDENVAVFLYKTFIYDMCRVLTDFNTRYHTLPRGFGMNMFHENFREFKGKVIFLFKTMLENRNNENKNILTHHLDVNGLMNVFESLVNEFIRKNSLHRAFKDVRQFIFSLTNEDFKGTLGDAINIYIIFRYIWEDTEEFDERMRDLIQKMDHKKQDLLHKVIFNVFPKLVSSIEMIDDTSVNSLRRVWFPVIAVCHYLNRDTKASFLKHVDRSNSQTKISALIDASQEFIPQMNAEYNSRNWILGFNLSSIYDAVRFITNLIGIAITFLNIGTYQLDDNSDAHQDLKYKDAELGLNITQIALAGILVLLWWFLLRKRHLTLMWERYIDQNIKTIGFLPPTIKNKLDEGDFKDLDASECKQIMILKGANSDEFQEIRKFTPSFKEIAFDYRMLKVYFVIKSTTLLWHLIYLGITIASLFHPLACIFQIFDIAIRSDTILQIYSSISRNARQFTWTLFLLVLVNVVYSSIGFFFMNDAFVNGDGEVLCETAFSCFLNVLNWGLRSGGGIGDIIQSQPYASDAVGAFVVRVLYDLSFFIFMIILLLNLIFGMIIDAFGDLRDEKTRNEEDQKNVCFICGIERSQFERHTNFEEHSLGEHNIWSYIYYIVYIQEKEKTSKNNMTDIERKVLEKYQVKDSSFIPIGKSLTLEKVYEIEKVNQEDDLSKVSGTVESIKGNLEEMNKQIKDVIFGKFGDTIMGLNTKMDELMKKLAKK